MITLKPQHRDIPDDVLSRAYDFGNTCLLHRSIKSDMAVAKRGGFFYFQCNVDKDWAQVTILDFTGNFLSHPRSGELRKIKYTSASPDQQYLTSVFHGGYSELGNEQMTNELGEKWSYPLIDDDKATFVINSTEVTAGWTSSENYGNVWWIGLDETTLSWRGPSNKHFPMTSDIHIPGFTQLEGLVEGGATLRVAYTPFSNKIYKDGAVLVEAPVITTEEAPLALIVGACYFKDTLICMTISDFESAFWFQVWKQVDNIWVEVGSREQTSRAKEPCYINKGGNLFVFGDSLYTISDDLTIYTKGSTIPVVSSGSRNVSGTGGYGSNYTYANSEQNLWPGINKLDALEYSVVSSSASFSGESTGGSGSSTSTVNIPVYRGNPATELSISMTSIGTFQAYTNGSFCSMEWTGIDDSTGTAAIKDNPCGGGFTVTATIQPQGITATYTQEDPAVTPLTITGPDVWPGNMNDYSVTGGAGNTTVTLPSGCGSSSITVTDECGGSASKTVRMPEGTWKLIVEEWATCSATYPFVCSTDPCQYLSIPATSQCGYSWSTWEGRSPADIEQFYDREYVGVSEGSGKTEEVWRWGAGHTTESSLGQEQSSTDQRWVCIIKRTYEWWCSATVKGW